MGDELVEDAPLTPEEVLRFGPCVEAQVWTSVWLQEARAPIAVAAGRPKLGQVFNSDGIGRMAVIRPCMSRGRRVRGLPPVYTPQMLEANASVFKGWPQFLDHVPAAVAETLAKHGRSVRDLGGQILNPWWQRDFVHEDDEQYGYRKGGVLAEAWATPLIRRMVGENPNLLHTSINAWPTSGKPGPCPWRPAVKGMLIEGIRRQPQGSVDYVVRGGAGGRLLVSEGMPDEGAWPEIGEWSDADTRLVVSLAESFYASQQMPPVALPSKPDELATWLAENAPHLLPALQEADPSNAATEVKRKRKKTDDNDADDQGMTEADVRQIMQESLSGMPSVEEFEQRLREATQQTIEERDAQRELSRVAERLIESAEGVLPSWKADLKARYQMLPQGPPATLLIESAEYGDNGVELTDRQVIEQRVAADLDRCRDLIAEARGKPRVTGEGGTKRGSTTDDTRGRSKRAVAGSHWRREFAALGLAESEDDALGIFGVRKQQG